MWAPITTHIILKSLASETTLPYRFILVGAVCCLYFTDCWRDLLGLISHSNEGWVPTLRWLIHVHFIMDCWQDLLGLISHLNDGWVPTLSKVVDPYVHFIMVAQRFGIQPFSARCRQKEKQQTLYYRPWLIV